MLLLSKESIASPWVQVEVSLAYSVGLLAQERFAPVQIDDIPNEVANSLPLIPRNSYNWLDGTGGLRSVLAWLNDRRAQSRVVGVARD